MKTETQMHLRLNPALLNNNMQKISKFSKLGCNTSDSRLKFM
jgi:hypothetical protein